MPEYPRMFRLLQQTAGSTLEDVPGTVERELAGLRLQTRISPCQSVAITAGSRGIANVAVITRAIVQHLQRLQAKPFIVPAMGSHGGGTAAGQRQVIESYGITEEFCGCPIRASMETIIV